MSPLYAALCQGNNFGSYVRTASSAKALIHETVSFLFFFYLFGYRKKETFCFWRNRTSVLSKKRQALNLLDHKSENPRKLRTNEINCHIYTGEIYLIITKKTKPVISTVVASRTIRFAASPPRLDHYYLSSCNRLIFRKLNALTFDMDKFVACQSKGQGQPRSESSAGVVCGW